MKKIILIFITVFVTLFIAYKSFPELVIKGAMIVERGRGDLVQKEVQLAEHKIVYLEREGKLGDQVLLLIHGFGGDKDNFTRFAAAIEGEYRIVVPDLPGFGESSRIQSASYDSSAQVERLIQFLRRIHVDKFHIAGNSMGGEISGNMALLHPERVLSLGLFDAAGVRGKVESDLIKELKQGRNPLLPKNLAEYDSFLHFIFVKIPFMPSAVKEYFMKQSIANASFNKKVWQDREKKPAYLQPVLSKINTPTLVLWGKNDRIIHYSCAEVFHAGLKNSKLILLDNMGHSPMIEAPELTAKHYINFIKNLKL